ncbi:hypothetical protein [Stieleria mannarensis]|uniref:hypothetical protein n=1 Tax=Stieleria mannarensis TaxID=2755585 RepID=UPI00160340AA|nr:hypothetical protein [Rhodopirellula sp. JC639]
MKHPIWLPVCQVVAWSAWIAGAADLLENFGLLQQLIASPETPWTELTFYAAWVKFILIGSSFVTLILLSLVSGRHTDASFNDETGSALSRGGNAEL